MARHAGWQYSATLQWGHFSEAEPSMRRQPWQTLPWRSGVGHSSTGASRTTTCIAMDTMWLVTAGGCKVPVVGVF